MSDIAGKRRDHALNCSYLNDGVIRMPWNLSFDKRMFTYTWINLTDKKCHIQKCSKSDPNFIIMVSEKLFGLIILTVFLFYSASASSDSVSSTQGKTIKPINF